MTTTAERRSHLARTKVMLGQGFTHTEIAYRLGVCRRTVERLAGELRNRNERNELMAQHLEASSSILFAGTARQGAQDTEPPDTQTWNWRRLSEDEQVAVNAAHAAARVAEAGLLAGLIR